MQSRPLYNIIQCNLYLYLHYYLPIQYDLLDICVMQPLLKHLLNTNGIKNIQAISGDEAYQDTVIYCSDGPPLIIPKLLVGA